MADDISTYRLALQDLLKDRGSDSWSVDDLDAALRLALADVSQRAPRELSADVTLAQDGRQVELEALGEILWVEEVWWPYEEASYPPRTVPFEAREDSLLLRTAAEPRAGEVVRVLYAAPRAIAGLDGEDETTVPGELRGSLVMGAAGYAALAKAAAMAREYAWPSTAAASVRTWGEAMLRQFEAKLKALSAPAGQTWVTWG